MGLVHICYREVNIAKVLKALLLKVSEHSIFGYETKKLCGVLKHPGREKQRKKTIEQTNDAPGGNYDIVVLQRRVIRRKTISGGPR